MAGLFTDFDPLRNVAANQYGTSWGTLKRGSLISFEYPKSFAMIPNIIHDPRPMLIITDIFSPNYIRGLNLHYLTFNYVKKILQTYSGNSSFSYANIKPDAYMATAFRMYSLRGVQRPKRLDSDWLKTVLASVRSFDAGELEKIRTTIEQQIQARLQAKANELTAYEEYRKTLNMAQQAQFAAKAAGVQEALTGGLQRNLATPEPIRTPTSPNTGLPPVG
jgi:hypothetical protein